MARADRQGAVTDRSTAFGRDGFLVIEDFVPTAECIALKARAGELVEAFEPRADATVFSTRSQSHAADDYFRTSGDKIRFFLEEDAVDADGNLTRPKALAINKIGHALHDLDPAFSEFSRVPRLAALSRELGVAAPLLLQSMYIFKQPEVGGEVTWHQDATFLYTDPISVVGFWFALEDATIENGCLWALPGQHEAGLKSRFRRTGAGLEMQVLDDTGWPTDVAQPLEVPEGTLVVLHGLLPHYSSANRTASSRQAYALHVIDGGTRYADDNWLQRRPDMPLRGFET